MSKLLTRTKSTVAARKLAQNLGGKFEATQTSVAGTVVGANLVSVGGQQYRSIGVDGDTGASVALRNIGTPAVALYGPATGGSVLAGAGSSGGNPIVLATPSGLQFADVLARTGLALAPPADLSASSINAVGAGHSHTIDDTIARSAITLTAGDGLSGLGDLTANRTVAIELSATSGLELAGISPGKTLQLADTVAGDGLAVASKVINVELSATSGLELAGISPGKTLQLADTVAGNGLTINDKMLAVGVATTIQSAAGAGLSVESNAVRLTAGYDPGANTSILASDATGKLTLPLFEATTSIKVPLLTTASGDLTIDPAGVVKFPVAQTLKTADFDSSFPILGWQINEVIGVTGQSALTIGKIAADELSVKVFVADETRVDRANQYWTKSYGIVAETFTTPSAIGGTVTVKFEDSPALAGAIFTTNDWLLFRIIDMTSGLEVANAWGQVSNYVALPEDPELGVTLQSWTFTLRQGATSTVIKKGRMAVDFGASGAALIHLSVLDAAGAPYIKMRKWAGADPFSPANLTTYLQIGEVASVSSSGLPYTPAGIGLYVRSTANAGRAILVDDNGLLIQGADFKLYNGANQTVNISYTGESFWVGLSALDKRLEWNSTTLSVVGAITANTGYIGTAASGWVIAAGQLTSTNIGLYAGDANTARIQVGTGSDIAGINSVAAGSDIAIWAGDTHANRASAEFRVRADGQMYATGATLSGAITATSGTITGDFSVTSGGKLSASGGGIVLTATGINVGLYEDIDGGVAPSTESKSIAFYDTPSTAAGLQVRQYVGKATDDSPHWNVMVAPGATSPLTMSLWHGAAAGASGLWFTGLGQVVGIPGVYFATGSPGGMQVLTGNRLTLNSGSSFVAYSHLLPGEDFPTTPYNLGSALKRWGTVYANNMVISGSISGSTLGGAEWEYAGSMVIDANAASNTTVSIVNQNASYTASLDVEGNITVGGNVDGVDVSAFYSAYGSHSHAWSAITDKPTTFAPSAHAYDDAVHTGSLSWSKVSKTGSNLNEIATRSHTVLSDIGSNTHATIDGHIGTSDIHVAHSGVSILGGNGLTGGGAITSTQTLHVAVSGLGLSVGTDAVTLTSSSAGEASAHILATDANGYTQVAKLGVGVAPSSYSLHVAGNSYFTSTIRGPDIDGDAFRFISGSNENYRWGIGTDADGYFNIIQRGDGFASQGTRLSINRNGKFGINRTDPTHTLDVSGTGRFTSTFYADDDLVVYDTLAVGGSTTLSGDLSVGTVFKVNKLGTRVGINCDPDQQFDLDVAGPIRGTYLVGKHAIQLDSAIGVWHFDGAAPYNLDHTGSNASHMGVSGTETGGVIYPPGKFGKAVQLGASATNLIVNPSFESDDMTEYDTNGTVSFSFSDAYAWSGGRSMFMVGSGNTAGRGFICTSVTTAGVTYRFSAYVRGTGNVAISFYDNVNGHVQTAAFALTSTWTRISNDLAFGAGSTDRRVYLWQSGAGAMECYTDAWQLEQGSSLTPYLDGSLGTGHSWSGTPHASSSSRTIGQLKFQNIPLNGPAGTVMLWVKREAPTTYAAQRDFIKIGIGSAERLQFYQSSDDTWVARAYNGAQYVYALNGVVWTLPFGWNHFAVTWGAGYLKMYKNGVLWGESSGLGSGGIAFSGAYAIEIGGPSALNGLIDEFVILDYAAEADLIRTIYESDAPVFVSSSVFHWRAPSRVPIWVDEFGFWAQGVNGDAMLGLYGGDPRNPAGNAPKPWGGVQMYENDLVIGRTTGGGAAIHWDDSENKLRIGVQSAEHLALTSTALQFMNATTEMAKLDGTTFTLGNTSGSHVAITNSTIDIKYGATSKISLDGSGNASFTGAITASSGSIAGALTMGAGGSITATNTVMDSSGISVSVSTDWTDSVAYRFKSGTSIVGGVFSYRTDALTQIALNANSNLFTGNPSENNQNGITSLNATGHGSGYYGLIYLSAKNYNTSSGVAKEAVLSLRATAGNPVTTLAEITTDSLNIASATTITGATIISGNTSVTGTLSATGAITQNGSQVWHAGNLTPSDYSLTSHNHDSTYSALSHNHNSTYSALSHNHDSAYSALSHNHSGIYANASHTHDYGTFVPAYTSSMTDSSSPAHVWDGAEARAYDATYIFDMAASANGSVPSNAKAVVVLISANWETPSQSAYMVARKRGSSEAPLVCRGLVSGINTDVVGIVELDATNKDIEIFVSNYAAPQATAARLIGYFI